MNARLHRVIFNAARGLRMVVQETATSNGKGAARSTGGASKSSGAASAGRASGIAAWALMATLAAIPAAAQIVADPSAPGHQRATILAAPNGVPLVNIQTPSAAGVSRNTFRQFDVNANGAILNNSRTNATTQLGGIVQGNPYLATGPARVILNEVNSSNPSYLRGYVEVAGSRAEVIIANPAGIQVDGGGFINASRVTLTTGTPQFNAGAIESFLVRGGTIVIDGQGLDLSRTDYAAILSRALNVNAGIWANNLKVVTGTNQVSADLGQITPTAGTGPAPAFALDVAALGGMYAGKIVLIGTEAGLGVRNAGTLSAAPGNMAAGQPALSGVGEFTISAAGRLENLGTVQATSRADLSATSLANSGRIASATELRITTQGELANTLQGIGGTLEGQRLELASTAGDIDNRGGIIRQTSAAALTITAPVLSNTNGGVIGAEPVPVAAPAPAADGTTGTGTTPTTGAGGTGTTAPTEAGTATGLTPYVPPAPGVITVAGTVRNDGGRIYAGGPITIQSQNVDNRGGSLSVANLTVDQPTFDNRNGTLNVGNFDAHVDHFDNTGGKLHAGNLQVTTTGDLLNVDGQLIADGDASLTVGGLLDNTRGTVSATGALTAAVGNALINTGGILGAGTDLGLAAGTLTNGPGTLRGGRDATIAVVGAFTSDGSVSAGRNMTVTAASLTSGAASVLGAGLLDSGALATAGDLRITTTGTLTALGQNLAAGHAVLQGTSVDLTGSQTYGGTLTLAATQGSVTTSGATVSTPGLLSIQAAAPLAGALVNVAGTLTAGQLDLHAANIVNTRGGQIVQTGTGATTIVADVVNNTGGLIASNGDDVAIAAGMLTNDNGRIEHAGSGTLDLTARTSLSNAQGHITGNNALAIHGGAIGNDAGFIDARQIGIDAASLGNRQGSIVQSGTEATHIAVTGALDNTAGRIATNARDATLQAGSFTNSDGHIEHAGTGTLAIDAVNRFDGNGGDIVSNGALSVHAGSFSQDAGTTSAQQVSIDAASLSNRGGSIVQRGEGATRLVVAGALNNTGGDITSNGVNMVLAAGTLINTDGTIGHAGSGTLDVTATTRLDNASGQIVGNGTLALHGGALNNDQGSIGAKLIGIDGASLSNQAGQIVQVGSGKATRIAVTGDLNNNGGLISTDGVDLALKAGGTLGNVAGRIEHAGAGTLSIEAGLFDDTHGELVTNGALAIRGGRFIHDGTSTAVKQLSIDVASMSNRGGTLLQTGDGATVVQASGELDNTGGYIASNGIDLTVAAGALINDDTRTSGGIGHAGDGTLTVRADRYSGTQGRITANTSLVIQGGDILSDGGSISAAHLTLDAASLGNRGGEIVQTGTGATHIAVAGAVDNSAGGSIASNGDLGVAVGSLNNQGGTLRAAGTAQLDLVVAGLLDNSHQGVIGSGGNTTVQAASLNNDGGRLTAVTDLRATVTGAATNVVGTLAANGNTMLVADSLDSTGGTIAAVKGALSITTAGQTVNDSGKLQAATGVTLVNGGLRNVGGTVTGAAIAIDTRGNAIDNTLGTVAAATTVDIQSGALANVSGLLQSGGAMHIDTHGQQLTNTQAAGYVSTDAAANGKGGIVSGDTLTLATGALDNTAGFIGAQGDITADIGPFTNADKGVLLGKARLTVDTHGATYGNQGGQTLSEGDLSINAGAGSIDNIGGLIRSTATATLNAASVVNANTLGTDQGIEGLNVVIATDALNNTSGAIRADLNTTITSSGRVDNTNGLISAKDTLRIVDPKAARTLVLTNIGGTLQGDLGVAIDVANFSGDGKLVSGKDLSLAFVGDITNNGVVSAAGNLSYGTNGKLTNNGVLHAGQNLTVSGGDVINNVGAEMSSGGTTTVNASGTLTNRGLIDGHETRINAGTLDNIGTGRVYGDHVAIAVGTLNNTSETVDGVTKSGTIAARERLDIGAGSVNNRDGALLFSKGDLYIGAALDADGHATGRTAELNNRAATIEALGNVTIGATTLNNTNGGVTWTMVQGPGQHVVEFSVPGSAVRYPASEVLFGGGFSSYFLMPGQWPGTGGVIAAANPYLPQGSSGYKLLVPSPDYPFAKFAAYYIRSPQNSADRPFENCSGGDASVCTTLMQPGAWYAVNDPIWALFGVTPPVAELSAGNLGRSHPDITVGQEGIMVLTGNDSNTSYVLQPFDHTVTQAEYDEWQAYRTAHQNLDTKTLAFINVVNDGITSSYDIFDVTTTAATPVLQTSAPGKILSGGNMHLDVATGTNDMSQIVAGGALSVTGGKITDVGKLVDATVTTDGVTVHTYIQPHSTGSDERKYDTAVPYKLVTSSAAVLTAARQEGNAAPAGTGTTIGAVANGAGSTSSAQGTGAIGGSTQVNPIIEVPSAVNGTTGATGHTAGSAQGGGSTGAASGSTADAAHANGAGHNEGTTVNANGTIAAGSAAPVSMVVRTSTPSLSIPTASLFSTHAGPNSHYLIATDAAFTGGSGSLSSNALINGLGLNLDATLKRLGDGFYEQQLIRDQLIKLTGYRYTDGYSSDTAEYTALMNAGVLFAQQYGLSLGIGLSAAQMAQLTSDIVWLVTQTVTLPDGSTEQVLVPQVYVRVKPGDIDGTGALLSGRTVDMQLTGTLTNQGGTIAGRDAVTISADTIDNLNARLTGGIVDLTTKNDLNVVGASIEAGSKLVLDVGGDLNVVTTTRTASSSTGALGSGKSIRSADIAAQTIDRVAGLYVSNPGGTLVAHVGGDANLVAAQVKSAGSIALQTGGDINLGTVTTGRSEDIVYSSRATRQDQVTQVTGTTIAGAGNVSLAAGHDLNAVAATLSAGTTLALSAKNDVTLIAGVDSSAATTHSTQRSGMSFSSLDASSSETTLARTTLTAGNVSIRSGGDMTLAAVKVDADTLAIKSEGKLNLLTQTTSSSKSVQEIDNDAAFTNASDRGQQDQTTNYNQFNVKALTTEVKGPVTVQVGVPTGTTSINGKEATTTATLATSLGALAQQPGMAWVDQIANDPKLAVQWQAVDETHKQWATDTSGLGPVSALVVAIVVGVATAGAGAQAVGGLYGTTASAAAATYPATTAILQAGITSIATQAAVTFAGTGDLNLTIKAMGSSQTIKNIATAMLTAGVLQGLSASGAFATNVVAATPPGLDKFLGQLQNQLIDGAASAVVRSAVNGTSFEDELKQGLLTGLLNTLAAHSANWIGDKGPLGTADLNALAAEAAHAIAGCAVGAARAGSGSGCAPGALSAVVAHMTAQFIDPLGTGNNGLTSAVSSIVGVLAVAAAGGSEADIYIAEMAGANAVDNNWLANHQKAQANEEYAAATTAAEKTAVAAKWILISGKQDILTGEGIVSGLLQGGWNDLEGISEFLLHPVESLSTLKQLLTDPDVRGQMGDSAFAALDAKLARMQTALDVGGDQNATQFGKDLGELAWQVGSLFVGADGVAKASVALGEVGIKAGTKALDAMGDLANVERLAAKGQTAVAGEVATPVTSGGTANAVSVPGLKGQLASENLTNIAAHDARLAKAVNGSGVPNPNFSVGSGTAAEANSLGQIWVGDGARPLNGVPGGLISADGTRVFRPPTAKPNAPAEFNPTGVQANFQMRDPNTGAITSNGHMVIK